MFGKKFSPLQTSTSVFCCCQTVQECMTVNYLCEFLMSYDNADRVWELSGGALSIHDVDFEAQESIVPFRFTPIQNHVL